MDNSPAEFSAPINTAEFFSQVFANTNTVAILIYDTTGKILDVNLPVQKSFGYSREDLVGKHFSVLFTEPDLQRNLPEMEITTAIQKGSFKDNNFVRHKNGNGVWANGESTRVKGPDGEIFLCKIIMDINEQKLLEGQLVSSNTISEDIIQSITEPLLMLDENFMVQKANDAFFKAFEIEPGELLYMNVAGKLDELWGHINLRQTLEKVIDEGAVYENLHVEVNIPDQGTRYLNLDVRPIKNSMGSRNRILLILRDVTNEKNVEKRREEFISYTSHELRTPITNIKAYLQLVERCIDEDRACDIMNYLTKTQNYVEKLSHLISDLHDVSKAISGKVQLQKSEFNFASFISDIQESAQLTYTKHRIVIEGNAHTKVCADKYRLQQVINNFLSNAVKYSPHADKIIISTSSDKETITVCVKDFGAGIPADKIDKLFRKFYRDERTEKMEGLGLGLFISKEIIKAHKGKIWAESDGVSGSSFYFSIPVK